MSVEIYYDRAFIKIPKGAKNNLEDLYVPVLCHGSSNCFNVIYTARGSREIPEKNWSNWKWLKTQDGGKRGKTLCTSEDITEYGVSFGNPSAYGDLPFKSRHRQFKDQMEAMRWFCNGIKTARTVEEYRELGNNIEVVDVSKPYDTWKRMKVTSTIDLIDVVNQIELDGGWASVSFYGREVMRPRVTRRRAERKEVDHYYVVEFELNGGWAYFYKSTSRGTKYSWYDTSAKRFRTEAEAARKAKHLSTTYKTKVERINRPTTI